MESSIRRKRRSVLFEPLDEIHVLSVCLDRMDFAEFYELVAFEGVERGRVEKDRGGH